MQETTDAFGLRYVVDLPIHDIHGDATLRRSRALLFAFLFTKVKIETEYNI